MRTKSPVYVIVGDTALRRQLVAVLRARDFDATPFSQGSDFLDATAFLGPGIAVLDMRLPDRSAMGVLEELLAARQDIPVIVTAAQAPISVAVQAIKKGADDFLEQPISEDMLLGMIENTAALLDERIDRQKEWARSESCLKKLSKRELEVLRELSHFGENYVVAERLSLTVRSVETYRSRIMRKFGATRFSDAVALCRLSDAGSE